MSRVKWRSLLQKGNFEFAHTLSGRLHSDAAARAPAAWAVCGTQAFVQSAVPALRTSGLSVAALSVMPSSLHNISARLQAQDQQDALVEQLNVPCGLSLEALRTQEGFEHVLLEADEPEPWLQASIDAIEHSGKTLVRAPHVSELVAYLAGNEHVHESCSLPEHEQANGGAAA